MSARFAVSNRISIAHLPRMEPIDSQSSPLSGRTGALLTRSGALLNRRGLRSTFIRNSNRMRMQPREDPMSTLVEPTVTTEEPHFGRLTPRMAAWREELLDTPQSVCVERAMLTTETYKLHQNEPMVLLRALMVKNVLEHMSIFIEPATLIAGNQASSNRAAPIMPEYAMDWVIDELDEFESRPGDRFAITEDAKQQLRDIAPYWEHNTLKDRGLSLMPPASRTFYDLGIIHPEGNITSGDAHIAVDYERALREGLAGYRARTVTLLAGLDLTDADQLKKSFFYRAVLITLDAVVAFAHRYAALAADLATTEPDTNRRVELLEMSHILTKVPEQPAETFHEAVQAVWLIQLCLQVESNGHSLSYCLLYTSPS